MAPRAAPGPVFVATLAAFVGHLSLAAPARADIPLSPDSRGNCGGTEGLVCRKGPSAGICRRTRAGESFCSTDEDSVRRANEILAARAEQSRHELYWGLAGVALFLAAIGGPVYLIRRRQRAAAPPPD